jgi:[acyl-carrier-protein] S-malonyltransferase
MASSIAFVFPGQGSQSVGMLNDLALAFPSVTETFNHVSERLGYDVWNLVQNGPEALLNQTEQTQVVMLTADVAVSSIVAQRVGKPLVMAGHSLGEYAALVCAGAMTLSDAAELVAHRGRLMQQEVPLGLGAMGVIVGLPDENVNALCVQASRKGDEVTPANFNAIGQIVIAGHKTAVDRAIVLAEAMGARMAKLIPVSVPCHCPLLIQAAECFDDYLQKVAFRAPTVPVISSVDLSVYSTPEQMRQLLKEQLYRPVRWVETIQTMKQAGTTAFIECGPGKVLSGLIKRIDKSLTALSVYDPVSLDVMCNCIRTAEKEQT